MSRSSDLTIGEMYLNDNLPNDAVFTVYADVPKGKESTVSLLEYAKDVVYMETGDFTAKFPLREISGLLKKTIRKIVLRPKNNTKELLEHLSGIPEVIDAESYFDNVPEVAIRNRPDKVHHIYLYDDEENQLMIDTMSPIWKLDRKETSNSYYTFEEYRINGEYFEMFKDKNKIHSRYNRSSSKEAEHYLEEVINFFSLPQNSRNIPGSRYAIVFQGTDDTITFMDAGHLAIMLDYRYNDNLKNFDMIFPAIAALNSFDPRKLLYSLPVNYNIYVFAVDKYRSL